MSPKLSARPTRVPYIIAVIIGRRVENVISTSPLYTERRVNCCISGRMSISETSVGLSQCQVLWVHMNEMKASREPHMAGQCSFAILSRLVLCDS